MDITQIISVIQIADQGSFYKAADALYISPSALSIRIRKLESELGVQLFERNHLGLSLTQEGKVFYKYAQNIVTDWERLDEKMTEFAQKKIKKFNIGVVHTAKYRGILDPVLDFILMNPDLEVHLSFNTSNTIIDDICSGSLDIGIAPLLKSLKYPEEPALCYSFLFSEETRLLVSSDNDLAKRDSITLKEVAKQPFIGYEDKNLSVSDMERIISTYRISPKFVYMSESLDTCYTSVGKGLGVRLDPASIAESYGLSSVPLDPPLIESYIHMIYRKNKSDNPVIRKFKEHIFQVFDVDERDSTQSRPFFG